MVLSEWRTNPLEVIGGRFEGKGVLHVLDFVECKEVTENDLEVDAEPKEDVTMVFKFSSVMATNSEGKIWSSDLVCVKISAVSFSSSI